MLVATIRDADIKSLAAIAAESRALAERVRDGRASPAELTGATFTVSNLGMYGMTAITPVINPPQAAISAATIGSSTAPTPPATWRTSRRFSKNRFDWRSDAE